MENKTKSTLNRYVRCIYWKMKNKHGVQHTREEALRIFALTTIERKRVHDEGATTFDPKFIREILNLCNEWGIPTKHIEQALTTPNSTEGLEQILLDLTPLRIRIRKLTPRECMRLQGVTDEDTDRMVKAGLSNSALYKLAGNSICTAPLEGIFTQLFRTDSDTLF